MVAIPGDAVGAATRAGPEPRASARRRLAVRATRCCLRARRRADAADRCTCGRRTYLLARGSLRRGAPCRRAGARPLARHAGRRSADREIVDPVLSVRLAAMRAVGEMREPRALVALGQQLDYYEGATAGRAALDALARIAHPSSAGLFAQERFSNMAERRRSAYEGIARLGGIRDTDVVAVEQRLTEERDEPVRLAMAFALAAGGRPYLDRVMQSLADRDLANQAIEYVVELGRAKPDAIAPYLQTRDPVVRARAAIAAGFTDGPLVEAELSRLTTDGDPSVRRAAEVAVLRTSSAQADEADRVDAARLIVPAHQGPVGTSRDSSDAGCGLIMRCHDSMWLSDWTVGSCRIARAGWQPRAYGASSPGSARAGSRAGLTGTGPGRKRGVRLASRCACRMRTPCFLWTAAPSWAWEPRGRWRHRRSGLRNGAASP